MTSPGARGWLAAAALFFVALAGLTVALVFWLVRDSGRWDLLPSMVLSRGRLQPARQDVISTARPLDIRPLPEIRLTAPAGALDKDRNFRVTRYRDGELAEFITIANAMGIDTRAVFRIDAGMRPNERFPGDLTVRIDLEKLGIPRIQWPRFAAVHSYAGTMRERMAVTLEGSEAVMRVRHNEAFTTGLLLVALGGLTNYLLGKDSPDGAEVWMEDTAGPFLMHWHPTEAAADPVVGKRFYDELRNIAQHYDNLTTLRSESARVGQFDPRIDELKQRAEALQATFENSFPAALRREKVWPQSVQRQAKALESAHEYLITRRGFKKPGYMINIYLRLPWPHGTASALTQNPASSKPFIDVSDETNPDEIQLNAVHELFHVVQKEYRTTADWASYGWFDEAGALILERDAQSYFLNNRLASTWPLTQRSYIAYQRAMADPPAGDANAIQHGYAVSHFLESLQRQYYSANADSFLKALYEDSSSWTGGTVKSMMRATSNKSETFSADFQQFVDNHSADILAHAVVPQERKIALTRGSPLYEWNRKPFTAVSARSCWIRVSQVPAAQQAGTKVVIQEVSPPAGFPTVWSVDGKTRVPVKDGEAVIVPNWQGGTGHLDVQRVDPYDEPSIETGSRTHIFAMIPPADAPTCTEQKLNKALRVKWTKSRLADLGLVDGYRIKLRPPSGPELTIKTKDIETDIPIADLRAMLMAQDTAALTLFRNQVSAVGAALRSQLTNQDLLDMWDIREYGEYLRYKNRMGPATPWRVRYQEVAVAKQEIVGGESPAANIDITPSDLDPGTFDPTGQWVGRILFTDVLIDMTVQSTGSGIKGAWELRGGKKGPWVGDFDAVLGGWNLKFLDKSEITRQLFNVPLVRFPRERLFLHFPPALFNRVSSTPPSPGTRP